MLTPQDIQNQQFHVRFRGFDPEEVDEFLEQAAATVQELGEENEELKKRLDSAERQVAAYKRQEKSAMSAILSAQNVAQEMKEKARAEAREVLARAREEAKGLEESAGREISDLEREVDRLRELKGQVRDEMRRVLEGYMARLDAAEEATTGGDPERPPAATSDDLYQRLELTDDLLSPAAEEAPQSPSVAQSSPQRPTTAATAPFSPTATAATDGDPDAPAGDAINGGNGGGTKPAAGDEEDNVLPDLDGDMVFNLEDPLDEDEEEDQQPDDHRDRGPVIDIDDEPEPDPKSS